MIIDFHTHAFPEKIALKTLDILKKNIMDVQNTTSMPPSFTDGTLSGLRQSMKLCEIDYSVVMPIATTVTQSSSINRYAIQVQEDAHIFSFGSVHPRQEDMDAVMEQIKESGLLGIKLHPEYQNFYVDSPEGIAVLKKAQELGLYVLYHAGADVGMCPPVHGTPQHLYNAMQSAPDAQVIAAHMGGWMLWADVEKYLCGTKMLFDTSYSIPFMEQGQFTHLVRSHGADKILFGTDSPWDDQKRSAAQVRESGLTSTELNAIFFENGAKILGLS